MDLSTRPIINPNPDPTLLDALSGADVCTACRGAGSLTVANPHDRRVCPACRGRGTTPYRAIANQYARLDAKSRRRTAAEVTR